MKKKLTRILAFILVFAMAVPVATALTKESAVSAASVELTTTKKTLVVGNAYTIAFKDSSDVAKKSFKSSNTKVATVNGKGYVKAIATGTAKITCTVTLKSGGTRALVSTITVKKRVPATTVEFKNVVYDELNAHILEVGEKYDFNIKLTPTNSTDGTYFTIADSDIASVNTSGVVTAKKVGITVLEARTGLNSTEANKETNKVVTKTYIYVKAKGAATTPTATPTPTPTVTPQATSVSLVSSTEIKIDFNTTIDKSTVIDSNGNLVSGTVTVSPGSGAKSYGNLTPKLSADKKSLSLTASGEFNGTYVVTVFSKVMTEDGQVVAPASFQNDFKDTLGPTYVNTEIADNGYISKINFSEAIDISNLAIISVNGTSNSTVKARLTAASNYILSADKKSLTIDLSGTNEKALNVMVTMVGIKDIIGNTATPYQMNVIVQIDATEKPVANIISAVRESKTSMVVTFDQPMIFAGYALVDGNYLQGTIDSENNKVVRFALTNTSGTGTKIVAFSGYRNYNMVNSTANNQTRAVDFTLDTTPPMLTLYEFTSEVVNGVSVQNIELIYSKRISAVNGSGILTALVQSVSGDILSKVLTYTAVANGSKLTLSFAGQTFESGNYTVSLPENLVMDSLDNPSQAQQIALTKQAGSSAALPQPVTVDQDLTNPSKIRLTFNNRLDIASAQNVSNYRVNGNIVPVSAIITGQTERNAVVELTFASASFTSSSLYTLTVSGVMGYNGSYGPMKEYNTLLTLVENSAPQVTSCKLTSTTTIQITLSEEVSGTGEFMVYTSSGLMNTGGVFVSGKTIYITLPVEMSSSAQIAIIKHDFKDANNNTAIIPPQLVAYR